MKEEMWLRSVKYFWVSLNTSWALVFCTDTHGCTISKAIGMNEEKETSLPNMEYISGH